MVKILKFFDVNGNLDPRSGNLFGPESEIREWVFIFEEQERTVSFLCNNPDFSVCVEFEKKKKVIHERTSFLIYCELLLYM